MLVFKCPYCGVEADETELNPGGEAHLKRFGPGSSDEELEGYLFNRENPKGVILSGGVMFMVVESGFMLRDVLQLWKYSAPIPLKRLSHRKRL